MDFSSIPAYLDPSNWQQQNPTSQQQQSHHHGNINPLLPPPPLPPPLQPTSGPQPGHMGGSIRPGSMAERARMANIPMPEPALKCPRCESTNTKFCYFNNYSLTQPRHFCKTCRRYWTRGGALRSVPVGGGCRRNKRSKSSSASGAASSSKSGASDRSSSAAATSSASSALSGGMTGTTSSVAEMLGLNPPPPQLSGLRFMSTIPEYGGGLGFPTTGDIGFHLGGIGGSSHVLSGIDHHPWRIPIPPPPQFPFLGGLDSGAAVAGAGNIYEHPFDGVELSSLAIGHMRSKGPMEVAAGVKMEESGGGRQEMSASLVRQFNLGSGAAGEHFNWGGGVGGGGGGSSSSGGGNAWTDMTSGINNSSCSTTSAM